jgi:hypothetical protein
MGGKSGREKRGGERGEWNEEVGREGMEGKGWKEDKKEGRQEEFGPRCSRQIDATAGDFLSRHAVNSPRL